jgi:hypothetical protein
MSRFATSRSRRQVALYDLPFFSRHRVSDSRRNLHPHRALADGVNIDLDDGEQSSLHSQAGHACADAEHDHGDTADRDTSVFIHSLQGDIGFRAVAAKFDISLYLLEGIADDPLPISIFSGAVSCVAEEGFSCALAGRQKRMATIGICKRSRICCLRSEPAVSLKRNGG